MTSEKKLSAALSKTLEWLDDSDSQHGVIHMSVDRAGQPCPPTSPDATKWCVLGKWSREMGWACQSPASMAREIGHLVGHKPPIVLLNRITGAFDRGEISKAKVHMAELEEWVNDQTVL